MSQLKKTIDQLQWERVTGSWGYLSDSEKEWVATLMEEFVERRRAREAREAEGV